jgi:hypothetical protein
LSHLVNCPRCNGSGDEVDYRKVHSRSVEPPYIRCPECGGNGEVTEEQAENYEPKSLSDYESERRFEEWEAREEERQDREQDKHGS